MQTHRGRLHRPGAITVAKRETGRRRANRLRALAGRCGKGRLLAEIELSTSYNPHQKQRALHSMASAAILTAEVCIGALASPFPSWTCDGGGRIGCTRSGMVPAYGACFKKVSTVRRFDLAHSQ
jgi:hypothetical protein